MSKINIKIVEIDQATHTAVVKYTSENSKKNIDEYPGVAFQVTNYNVTSLEAFIEAIRPQVSLYVWQRDQAENPPTPVNITDWNNYSAEVEAYTLAEAALDSQLPAVQQNPEVQL